MKKTAADRAASSVALHARLDAQRAERQAAQQERKVGHAAYIASLTPAQLRKRRRVAIIRGALLIFALLLAAGMVIASINLDRSTPDQPSLATLCSLNYTVRQSDPLVTMYTRAQFVDSCVKTGHP